MPPDVLKTFQFVWNKDHVKAFPKMVKILIKTKLYICCHKEYIEKYNETVFTIYFF